MCLQHAWDFGSRHTAVTALKVALSVDRVCSHRRQKPCTTAPVNKSTAKGVWLTAVQSAFLSTLNGLIRWGRECLVLHSSAT